MKKFLFAFIALSMTACAAPITDSSVSNSSAKGEGYDDYQDQEPTYDYANDIAFKYIPLGWIEIEDEDGNPDWFYDYRTEVFPVKVLEREFVCAQENVYCLVHDTADAIATIPDWAINGLKKGLGKVADALEKTFANSIAYYEEQERIKAEECAQAEAEGWDCDDDRFDD